MSETKIEVFEMPPDCNSLELQRFHSFDKDSTRNVRNGLPVPALSIIDHRSSIIVHRAKASVLMRELGEGKGTRGKSWK